MVCFFILTSCEVLCQVFYAFLVRVGERVKDFTGKKGGNVDFLSYNTHPIIFCHTELLKNVYFWGKSIPGVIVNYYIWLKTNTQGISFGQEP